MPRASINGIVAHAGTVPFKQITKKPMYLMGVMKRRPGIPEAFIRRCRVMRSINVSVKREECRALLTFFHLILRLVARYRYYGIDNCRLIGAISRSFPPTALRMQNGARCSLADVAVNNKVNKDHSFDSQRPIELVVRRLPLSGSTNCRQTDVLTERLAMAKRGVCTTRPMHACIHAYTYTYT